MFFLYSIRGVLLVFENVFRSWRSFIKTLVVLVRSLRVILNTQRSPAKRKRVYFLW